MSTALLNRRITPSRNTADWQPGEYGVLDLDRLCPNGPCAPPPARDAWLPEVLAALDEKERAA